LAPTWETLAKVMTSVAEHLVDKRDEDYTEEDYEHAKKVELPVMVAKMDCVLHREVCQKEQIMAYPTLRLYVDGTRWRAGDYNGHRTVADMADWLQQIEDTHKTELENDASKNVQLAHESKSTLRYDVLHLQYCQENHCSHMLLSFRQYSGQCAT
jgi:hypothetical protein